LAKISASADYADPRRRAYLHRLRQALCDAKIEGVFDAAVRVVNRATCVVRPSHYFGIAPLAGGGACDIGSLVGRVDRLIGMLSGLVALAPLAGGCGGLAIDASLGAGAFCANAAPVVPAQNPASAAITTSLTRMAEPPRVKHRYRGS
jgi:hypothetical protein